MPSEMPPVPEMPSFIRGLPDTDIDPTVPPPLRFNFWSPIRSGYAATDYAAGRQHFATARAFAQAIKSRDLLAHIVGGMCGKPIGAVEAGFLDEISSKATSGRAPEPISDEMARLTNELCGVPVEEIRYGEEEARTFLEVARLGQTPELIRTCMDDIVSRTHGYGALTFMWTVCGAAYVGAAQ